MLPHPQKQETAHGLLVIVELPAPDSAEASALWGALHETEKNMGKKFAPRRRITFAGGRYALRCALSELGYPKNTPIPRNHRGAPTLPDSVRGSISHKDPVACALVEEGGRGHIGVDVEEIQKLEEGIGQLVLTSRELAQLPSVGDDRDVELILKISLKESLYKALDPFVERYVGFKEVEVSIDSGGTANFELNLKNGEGPFTVDARWTRLDDRVFSSVRVTR